MYYIRTYPLSIITIIVIWYLSFFTPPQTELNNVPFIDKIVHICMYGRPDHGHLVRIPKTA